MIRRTRNKKKLFLKIVIGLFVFVFIVVSIAITAYLMAVYKPSEYAPVPISRDIQEQAVDQAIALVADIHNNIYAETEFTQTFESRLINQILLHDDLRRLLEDEFDGSELSLELPQISMRDGLLIFYITMKYYDQTVVVSILLKPYIENNELVIDLVKVKSGALGVPMGTINKYLIRIANTVKEYSESLEKTSDKKDDDYNVQMGRYIGKKLPELLKNKRIVLSPVITKPDDDKISVTLTAINIADQKTVLSFKQQKK